MDIKKDKNKILFIEDDRFLAEMLIKKLEEEGFNTEWTLDASDGLERLRKAEFDLIILDLLLPGEIDGFKFLEKIKAVASWKDIPVVILSNLGQKEEIERGFRLGVLDYLVKANFTLDEIIKKIKKILSEKRS